MPRGVWGLLERTQDTQNLQIYRFTDLQELRITFLCGVCVGAH